MATRKLPKDFEERKASAKSRVREAGGSPEKSIKERTRGADRLSRSEGLALLDWKNEKRHISPEDIFKFSQIGATYDEIGRYYGVTKSTIYQRISNNQELLEAYERGYAELTMSLRRAQLINAIEKGNPISQIFLGKNYLGQRDMPVEKADESNKKQEMPDWLKEQLKTSGTTSHSEANVSSTPTSKPDTKGSQVQ